jgi:hypothetical protein
MVIDVARTFVTIFESLRELDSSAHRFAVLFDIIITLFILLALGPNHAVLVSNSSRSFISEYYLSEIVSFVVILLLQVRVVV